MSEQTKSSKKRSRFTFEDDVLFLREVASQNPFKNGKNVWEGVKDTMFILTKKQFTVKSLRQHLSMLIDQWTKKDTGNQKSSGIKEPYTEKDTLLQEITEVMNEYQKNEVKENNTKEKNTKENVKLGKQLREETAQQFYVANVADPQDHNYFLSERDEAQNIIEVETETSEPQGNASVVDTPNKLRKILQPVRSRAKRTTYIRRSGLDYLKEKNEKELELEEKRLKIEERKVAVAERRIELDEQRFLFDREQYTRIFNTQQETISRLLDVVKQFL